ncbi:hypothetical protein MKW92_039837, partial [Papaver armeniacum]
KRLANPCFEKRPKQFGIGGALPPKNDLHRFQRLKVLPDLNRFTKTLDKNLVLHQDKAAKKERLLKRAQAESEGKIAEAKKPIVVKYGLNHITYLIERNKAQMVIISHDVDPIELVFWLPALCRKMEIPYAIVKGKVRLRAIVHKKTASALCLTSVKNEDNFGSLIVSISANFSFVFPVAMHFI